MIAPVAGPYRQIAVAYRSVTLKLSTVSVQKPDKSSTRFAVRFHGQSDRIQQKASDLFQAKTDMGLRQQNTTFAPIFGPGGLMDND